MFLVLIFICIPVLGLPVYLRFYFCDKEKRGILYSLLIGFALGLIAYYFIPPFEYDLFRHHHAVIRLSNLTFSTAISLYKTFELEIIPFLYSFIISKLNNIDLLQFFIVSIGYSILFYMLYDYRKKIEINDINFLIIVLFTIFGFLALNFISGLYCYIAIIVFAFALYNEYIKEKNKILSYILYVLTLFMHTSMFFPFAILVVYKIFKNKLNAKNLTICIACVIFAEYILLFLSSVLNVSFIDQINTMYRHYISRNGSMKKLYSGTVAFVEITKIIMTIICIVLQKERKKTEGINGYIILLTILTTLMLQKSIVMIRFAMLIQFLGIVPMADFLKVDLKEQDKMHKLIYFSIVALCMIYIAYFFRIFIFQNFGNFFNKKIYRDIFTILRK